jgi:hypothetical protein
VRKDDCSIVESMVHLIKSFKDGASASLGSCRSSWKWNLHQLQKILGHIHWQTVIETWKREQAGDIISYLRVYPWALRLYYPEALLYSLRRSPRLYSRKYKNVTITLQKEWENPLKISFCFQTGDKTVIYVSTHGHWDCTTLQHHCTTLGFASGYTEVLQGSTISMPTGKVWGDTFGMTLQLTKFLSFQSCFVVI